MAADQREMHGKSMGFRDLDRQTGIDISAKRVQNTIIWEEVTI